jgi:Chaperone of endosialidase
MSVRVPDLPDLGAPTDDTLVVVDHMGTGVVQVSALRDYITVASGGPYLPLTGGTLTGTLTTNAVSDITSGRDAYVTKVLCIGDGAGGFPWQFYTDGSGNRTQYYGGNGFDAIQPNGTRVWNDASNNLMVLSPDGTLSVKTTVTAPAVNATNMNVSGTVTAGAISSSTPISTSGAITSSGVITGAGFSTGGDVNAGNVNVTGQVSLGSGFRIPAPSPNREIFWSANWRLSWATGTGNLTYIRDGDSAALFSSIGNTGEFVILGANAYKPGGGSWTATSDNRVKTIIGDYTRGLPDILALSPKRYTYLGNDTLDAPVGSVPYSNSPNYIAATDQREFAGLVAQDIQSAWPEMVSSRAGFIDGTADPAILTVDRSDLNLALVNAIKTLEARIAALEAVTARTQAQTQSPGNV